MAVKLQVIDELTIEYHSYLTLNTDECHYLFNYTAHKNFSFSEANSLISNLKKCPSNPNAPGYAYKGKAINQVATIFRDLFDQDEKNEITFVPIPPSKNKEHEAYDDRMLQILVKAFGNTADVRELIEQIDSTVAAHTTNDRPTPQQIEANLRINEDLVDGVRDIIVVVDDVITTGAHFIAVKRKLKTRFPNANVIGVFICRREVPEEEFLWDDF